MRTLGVVAMLVLVAPLFAGCIGGDDVDPNALGPANGLRLGEVPEGATVNRVESGLELVWEQVPFPFHRNITIPEGTTMVRVTATVGETDRAFVQLVNQETGRRRCQTPSFDAWDVLTRGEVSCAGLTAVDPLPSAWWVRGYSLTAGLASAELVTVQLVDTPLDGPAAALALDQLSMPVHEVQETFAEYVTAHDGAELYVEVTLPEGEGPWPVALASSPYTQGSHAAGEPSMWEYFVHDWAKRGYAVVVADVRGYANSGGCVEVWGPNEQADQVTLVEWAADQAWSNGNVGFYGQSYVGTTPVEAAINAPEALKAIIAVAPVINAYDDWHFGGVPNGENAGSPIGYQQIGTDATLDMADPLRSALNVANGVCDPTLVVRANDPRGIYDDFYEERNFSKGAANVEAAVLYTQGFEDTNVKSAMANHWFNALDAPKLGIFGHWVHQHPVRADQEVLFLAWMDQYVKGKAMGLEALPNALVTTNVDTQRAADTWPAEDARMTWFYPDFTAQTLGGTPTETTASLLVEPTGLAPDRVPARITLTGEADRRLHISGSPRVSLAVTLDGTSNAHIYARLVDQGEDGDTVVSWGMANLAHREGHDRYEPVAPGETVRMGLPMLPTEYVVERGHTLRLEVRGAVVDDWFAVSPGGLGRITLEGGQDGTSLDLPILVDPGDEPTPMSAQG